MTLTIEEQQMLDGQYGIAVQRAMELLKQMGEAVDAPRMVKVESSHIVPPDIQLFLTGTVGSLARELLQTSLEGATRFRVPTTINPLQFNVTTADQLNIPQWYRQEVEPIIHDGMRRYSSLGVIPCYTCCPFYDYPARFGQHLGGAESVAILYYNSVIGARVNRESGPTALASSLTGRTPLFGMHLSRNRQAQIRIELDEALVNQHLSVADYSALTYYVGAVIVDRIPVFTNLPQDLRPYQLKALCAPLGVSAGIPMFHAVGITPEAPSVEEANEKPESLPTVRVSKRDVHDTYARLTTASSETVDVVILGCPHASIEEIEQVSVLLRDASVAESVRLIVATSRTNRLLAEGMGLAEIIKGAGGSLVSDMCAGVGLYGREGIKFGVRTIATNAAKVAHYVSAHSKGEIGVWFGSLKECINTAITGRWKSS